MGNEVSIDTKIRRCDKEIDILESEEKQLKIIEKGDVVNLSDLLFTENRDYLIRYNDPELVLSSIVTNSIPFRFISVVLSLGPR